MKYNHFETFIGLFIVIAAIFCLYFGYSTYNYHTKNSKFNTIYATFQNAEGITKGSHVLISGIRVGTVEELTLDPNTLDAVVELKITANVKLPSDSQAAIVTKGLLGEKYISIVAGIEEQYIKDKDQIKFTQSSINVENLISKLFLNYTTSKSSSEVNSNK